MNSRNLILAFLFVLTAPAFARDKTDRLIMKNGDSMTCEIKGLDAGVLYVSFDYIDGTASVDWSKVARLESTQLFVVNTEDGSVFTGALKTAETGTGRPVQIRVLEPPEQVHTFESSQIVRMVETSDKFWERFNGGISFGTIYSKGNESTQYSLGASTEYVRERWNAGAGLDSNLSKSTGTTASTRNSLAFTALHLMSQKNWFYEGVGGLLQSSAQGISLQTLFGGGVGRYLKNTNRASIQLLGGAGWQDTTYQPTKTPISHQNTAAALIYVDARLFKFSKTNLDATASILPALSDPGRVRIATNASYYIKIISDLKWNVSFYGNWDNQPPPGFSGSDYGVSSGLSWTYGLK
jgi:Protein of unknown function, DUF481